MSIDITQQALNALADAGLADTIRLDGQQLFRLAVDEGDELGGVFLDRGERSVRAGVPVEHGEHDAVPVGGEQVGDCPIAHESGNAMDDSEREWWVNLAASAWTLIDGTEETE